MPVVTMKQLLEAGVHFGHQTRRWNPKMRDYIFGERNGIYIVDLQQTLERIDEAYRFVRDLAADGEQVLFVGTKKQAQEPVQRHAGRSGMPYVNFRWLGGMLTNFQTIKKRVDRMIDLEQRRREGEFELMPKREALRHSRELDKLHRYLDGIRNLDSLPSAVFVIDTNKEEIAVREANKLKIPVVAIVDTNCDPDMVDHVIPGNDDAIRSATLMCRIIADAVDEGRFMARQREGRKGTSEEDVAEQPPLDPEEERRRAEQQARARAEAAAAQKRREERLVASKEGTSASAEEASEGDSEAGEGDSGDDARADVAERASTEGG